jgi:hypothetical protein
VTALNRCDPYRQLAARSPDHHARRQRPRRASARRPSPSSAWATPTGDSSASEGIPTAVYGPRVHRMGGPDEYVEQDEVLQVAQVHLPPCSTTWAPADGDRRRHGLRAARSGGTPSSSSSGGRHAHLAAGALRQRRRGGAAPLPRRGIHGDEVNGVAILARVLAELDRPCWPAASWPCSSRIRWRSRPTPPGPQSLSESPLDQAPCRSVDVLSR